MNREDMDYLAGVVRTRSGLVLGEDPTYLIETRLASLARAEELASVEALVGVMRASGRESLLAAAAEALVNGETHFFRDRPVWEALRDTILPALAESRGGEAVRVWSAACATGQEPYSLAMLAAETGLRLDVCASDLSERCLEKARAALYTQFEVQRGLAAARLLRHFDKLDEAWRVKADLRQAVRWRRFNLIDPMAPLGRFDLVLCRNVLNGFSAEVREDALARLSEVLAPGGVLVLGLGEPAPAHMEEAAPSGRGLFRLRRGAAALSARTGT